MKVQAAAEKLHDYLQSLKTRTPAAIYEITELVKEHKLKIPDPNTKDGKVTAEVQSFGPVALFELNLVSQRLKAAINPPRKSRRRARTWPVTGPLARSKTARRS